jgi:hypothetical protein
MKLFAQQAKDVDMIITTALIPGKPAPKLITRAMVGARAHGTRATAACCRAPAPQPSPYRCSKAQGSLLHSPV